MARNVAEAAELLIAVRAYITSQMNICEQTPLAKQGQVTRHVASNNIPEAFKTLPALCCFFEQQRAFSYLITCLDATKRHMPVILSAPECPADHVESVAPLCYLQRAFKWKELDRFVSDFLVKAWKKANVEKLVRADTIPNLVTHVRPRAEFSLDEMHGFARVMERELKMDFGWLFAAYPATDAAAGAASDVVVGGRKKSGPVAPPIQPDAPSEPECIGDLPVVRPFEFQDYSQMLGFVAGSLLKWNSWTFEVPN
jgi:hypothetical protein